jgi:AcrR family transcriptional regulator
MLDEAVLSRSDRTRRAIIESAYGLFTSQGYAATSMRQIAEGASLALGSMYNHFASKEELFAAIVAERHPYQQIMPLLNDAQGNTMDEFIRNAASRMVAELDRRPEFLNLMLIELVEFKGRHAPKLFEKIYPDIVLLTERISAFQDDLRPIPLPMLMRAFMGMFFSYFLTGLLLKDLMPPAMRENSLDIFVNIFLNGIKQPAPVLPQSSPPPRIPENL